MFKSHHADHFTGRSPCGPLVAIAGRPGIDMTEQEEYDALLEEYFQPWPTFYGPKITRRATRRKEIVRNRLKELRKILDAKKEQT